MATPSANSQVVARYARSMLQLANGRRQAAPIHAELLGLREVLDANPALAQLLANPGVSVAARAALLQRVFAGRVSQITLNFLGVLNEKGRLALLPEIIEAYDDHLEAQLGNVEVDVTVARRLDAGQLEDVRRRVGVALGRTAIIHQSVDESILGGLVLRVGDKLIDASVRFQIETLRKKLLGAVPT